MSHITLKAEEIFHIFGFPITNTFLLALLAVLLLTAVAVLLRMRLAFFPVGLQNIAETVLEAIFKVMDSVLLKREKSEKYLPLVATIFLFILTSNWLGLLPGVGSLGLKSEHSFVPLLRSPASDLNFTLALALITVLTANIYGVVFAGFKHHLSKYFNFKSPVNFFIGILELISEFAKIVSFSFRLFGNIFAGEVLLVIIAFLVPFAAPLPFLFLEIFVGFIQAFIFSMLALIFIAIATTGHETNLADD